VHVLIKESVAMQDSSHFRVISLLLALVVLVGGWLLFEYGNQTLPHVDAPSASSPRPLPPASPVGQPSARPAPLPSNLAVTYKCEKNGRLSFRDQPCATGEKVLSVSAGEQESSAPSAELQRLKDKLAIMEADRHQRERQYAANTTVINVAERPAKELCEAIDKRIELIDAQLRLPHTGPSGDSLNAERKKANDEKYTIGC
jgi:hypothetical protein